MKRLLSIFSLAMLLGLLAAVSVSLYAAQATPAASAAAAVSSYNWLQFGGGSRHAGVNTAETMLNASNVFNLKILFQIQLLNTADGAPVYLSNVVTAGGTRPLIFVSTMDGHIQAIDALTGAGVWNHQNGPGSCKINNGSAICYTTSSPVIDPNLSYVYSYGLDGFVHKYQVGNGTEITTGGWPELVSLKPYDEKGSSALSTVTTSGGTTYLYAANAGYPGDNGDYQGHITAINLGDGAQKVFNADCSDQVVHFKETPGTPDCPAVQTAIWARPGVVYSSETGRIYMATGNGDYNPSLHDWGDSVFALNPDGTGAGGNPLDSYTPTNFAALQAADADLGSTAPALLPVLAGSSVPHLAVQGGKDAKLRLINLDNLSGHGGPGFTAGEIGSIINVPQGGEVLTQPAVWTNPADNAAWVFVTTGSGIAGIKVVVANGTASLSPVWHTPNGGTSPIVVNNVLFYAGSGVLRALDPATGNLLWSSSQIGGIHWESPIVANSVLYVTDGSQNLTAYSLFGLPPSQIKYTYVSIIKK